MSERTDEKSSRSDADGVDVDELLDDDFGSGGVDVGDVGDADAGPTDDAGLADDDLGVDVDALTSDPGASPGSESQSTSSRSTGSSLLGRLTPAIGFPDLGEAIPSGRSVLLSFLVVFLSAAVVGNIPVLGWLPGAGVFGIVAGTFALGLASGERRYLELALAGAAVTAGFVAWGSIRFAFFTGIGLSTLAAVGGIMGALAALIGHYFGRDLRAGLTRDVEDF